MRASFFQKRVPESRPEWQHTAVVSTPNGTASDAPVTANWAVIASRVPSKSWGAVSTWLGFNPRSVATVAAAAHPRR